MQLTILTPDGTAYRNTVVSVTSPTAAGDITVLPGHIPLLTALVPGTLILRDGRTEEYFAVTQGVVRIDGKTAQVLGDTAERTAELEEEAIEAARARAE